MTKSTNSGQPPTEPESASVPNAARRPDGQFVDHWVLSAEERAKGFQRPARKSYRHVGSTGPIHPLRDLTTEESERYSDEGYAKFEQYPASESPVTGKFWTQAGLDAVGKGCGVVTSMPPAIAETYARQPGYYGSTFCCGCGDYFPVGVHGEFVWENSDERVGS